MKNLYCFNLFLPVTTFLVVCFLLSTGLKAQNTLQVSSNITPQQMVQEILIGGGVVTSNITYSGNNISRGKFWGGPGSIGISEGIILTSGNYKGTFDLKGEPEGIYLLKLIGGDKVIVRKIVLQ